MMCKKYQENSNIQILLSTILEYSKHDIPKKSHYDLFIRNFINKLLFLIPKQYTFSIKPKKRDLQNGSIVQYTYHESKTI